MRTWRLWAINLEDIVESPRLNLKGLVRDYMHRYVDTTLTSEEVLKDP